MQDVHLAFRVEGVSAATAFDRMTDFEAYAEHSEDIRQVRVHRSGERALSTWEVSFQQGILTWTEEDRADRATRTIGFELVEGDFDVFRGYWRVEPEDRSSTVTFTASFDFGVSSLNSIIEPVAARLLSLAIGNVVLGTFADQQVVELDTVIERG